MKKNKYTIYEIDQSGKIEQTSKDTVLAIANGKEYTILLKAKDKRLLQEIYRTFYNKRRQFVYEVFSALLYILISSMNEESNIIIDKEYPGKESLIKLHILEYDIRGKISLHVISFALVGKSSPAHNAAYLTFTGKKKPSKVITIDELIKILFPNKKTGYSSISGTEGS